MARLTVSLMFDYKKEVAQNPVDCKRNAMDDYKKEVTKNPVDCKRNDRVMTYISTNKLTPFEGTSGYPSKPPGSLKRYQVFFNH